MPKKTQSSQIDGVTYHVTQFGGVKAFEVMSRMGMGVALQELSAADLQWLRAELAACTKVEIVDTLGDGKKTPVDLPMVYDDHFAGGPEAHASMLKWLKFAVEANFGPFGDVVPRIVKGLRELLPSSSRKTSTGGSGGSSPPAG